MAGMFGMTDVGEVKTPEFENYKEIKPEDQISPDEAKGFLRDLFSGQVASDDRFEILENIPNYGVQDVSNDDKIDVKEDSDNKEISDAGESYYSTYVERIQHTPGEGTGRGEWDGERGESKFIPTDENIIAILQKYGMDGISYHNGIPDFSDCSESTVEIDNMTDNRASNFKQCDEKCAEQWNKEGRDGRTDWTARDVANWRKENGYSWHERNDMKTCDLVPTEINDYFGHLGGVSECKKRDAEDDRGEFDE